MAAGDLQREWDVQSLLDEYTEALRAYLAGTDPTAISKAEQFGRKALARGLSALALASVHHRATVAALLGAVAPPDRAQAAEALRGFCSSCPAWYGTFHDAGPALETFFLQVLEPFVQSHETLRESNTVLRRLQDLREEEAKRIAHALHDDVSQLLFSAKLALDGADSDDAPARRAHLGGLERTLEHLAARLRQLSHELRPTVLDDLGLTPALELLAQGMSKRSGVSIRLESEVDERLPAELETAFYRIVQEALMNVVRHAGATFTSVRLFRDGENVCCSIRDNGRGFDADAVQRGTTARGLGLLGVRERLAASHGDLDITSSPGRGTEVLARIPLSTQVANAGRAGGLRR